MTDDEAVKFFQALEDFLVSPLKMKIPLRAHRAEQNRHPKDEPINSLSTRGSAVIFAPLNEGQTVRAFWSDREGI